MKYITRERVIWVGILVAVLVFFASLDTCRNTKFSQQQSTIDSLTLANQQLYTVVNKKGDTITRQEVIITGSQAELKQKTADIFDLKAKDAKRVKQINALIQEKSSTGVKDVDVAYEEEDEWVDSPADSALVGIPCDSLSYVRVPRTILVNEKDFQFAGTINKSGLHIDSLNFPDSQRIAIIETKGGFFKRGVDGKVKLYRRPSMEIQVMHTNKHVKIDGLSSVVYQPKVRGRWLERLLLLGAGVYLGSQLNK